MYDTVAAMIYPAEYLNCTLLYLHPVEYRLPAVYNNVPALLYPIEYNVPSMHTTVPALLYPVPGLEASEYLPITVFHTRVVAPPWLSGG